MNTSVSLDNILQSLHFLSGNNKRWLATNLMKQAEKEETKTTTMERFDEITQKLWQLPMDESVSTEEVKAHIRKSRLTGVREITSIQNHDTSEH